MKSPFSPRCRRHFSQADPLRRRHRSGRRQAAGEESGGRLQGVTQRPPICVGISLANMVDFPVGLIHVLSIKAVDFNGI